MIASVDTYLRVAEATNRLDLHDKGGKGLTEVIDDLGGPIIEKVASDVVENKVEDVIEKTSDRWERSPGRPSTWSRQTVTGDRSTPQEAPVRV